MSLVLQNLRESLKFLVFSLQFVLLFIEILLKLIEKQAFFAHLCRDFEDFLGFLFEFALFSA